MIARCPNNRKHGSFRTTAHVMQLWQVDETGEFQKELDPCLQVSYGPDPDNYWYCTQCEAKAEFVDDEEETDELEVPSCPHCGSKRSREV